MKYLLTCRPAVGVIASDFAPHLDAERAVLSSWRTADVLTAAYSPGGPGAILIIEAADSAAAQSLADGLPLRAAGVITVEITELHPLEF